MDKQQYMIILQNVQHQFAQTLAALGLHLF